MHAENTFTTTLANLAPPKESNEKLLPGGIYILVATMFGTIISRNRNIALRFLTPLTTGVGGGEFGGAEDDGQCVRFGLEVGGEGSGFEGESFEG